MADINDVFMEVMEGAEADLGPEDRMKVNQNVGLILDVVKGVHEVFGDGLQLSDAAHIGKIVAPLMRLAASFLDYEGMDKRRFVSEVVWLVYKTIDTYPDGQRNNINIPFLFGVWERKIERGMVHFAAQMAVDALYDRMKADGEV
jgi:hypothetical protein